MSFGFLFAPAMWASALLLTWSLWHTGARNALLVVLVAYVASYFAAHYMEPSLKFHGLFIVWFTTGMVVSIISLPTYGLPYLLMSGVYAFSAILQKDLGPFNFASIITDILGIFAFSLFIWFDGGGSRLANPPHSNDRALSVVDGD